MNSHRPQSLREVAERADDLEAFGGELQDWLHTIRSLHSRPPVAAAIANVPPRLAGRFPDGAAADAWLAAYADHTARQIGCAPPAWCLSPDLVAPPWFTTNGRGSRLLALRDSPPAFKNRNIFTPKVDLPLNLRAGRPRVSAEQRRRKNAERQRRFRQRRAEELARLRAATA
jgi:hypothetical protein